MRTLSILTLAGTLLLAATAHASGGETRPAAPTNPTWNSECAACHVAYPARLLPATSWKRLMGNLDRHFGSDASLDPAAHREILAYLERNAGPARADTAGEALPRITQTPWFVREHDEVPANTWKDPRVKSASNCAACHTRADSGSFRERELRVPR
jgi:cytochrome c553